MVIHKINTNYSFLNLTPEQIRLMHRFLKVTDEMKEAGIKLIQDDDEIVAINNESGRVIPAYQYYYNDAQLYDQMKLEEHPEVGMRIIDMMDVWDHTMYQPIYVKKDAND